MACSIYIPITIIASSGENRLFYVLILFIRSVCLHFAMPKQISKLQSNHALATNRPQCLDHDSVVTLAFAFVTFTPSCFARAMISSRFRAETACAILPRLLAATTLLQKSNFTHSAANVWLCMRRRSTSLAFLTRKALWPEGIRCRVFLLEP